MALRYDRRGSTVGGASAFSAADVGRSLRHERTRQGLSLHDVSIRTGIPQDQLRAAETGALDPANGLSTLKTVRRFADLLGLPGDRYALAILEQWPTRGRGTTRLSVVGAGRASRTAPTAGSPNDDDTGVVPATPGPSTPGNGTRAVAAADDRPTLAVGAVSRWGDWTDPASEPLYPDAYSDTGVTPAVAGAAVFRPDRRMPTAMRALIVLVAVAVAAGVALLAVDRLRPAWLRDMGLIHAAPPAAAAPAVRHRSAGASQASGAGALRLHRVSTTEAVVHAGTAPYTVKVSALGGRCWVEVTSSTTATPLFAGVMGAGSSKSFSSGGTMTVELGSTSGSISVVSKSGHLSVHHPSAAPFRYLIRQ